MNKHYEKLNLFFFLGVEELEGEEAKPAKMIFVVCVGEDDAVCVLVSVFVVMTNTKTTNEKKNRG